MSAADRYIAENYNLENEAEYTIEWIDAVKLLNADLLDIFANWMMRMQCLFRLMRMEEFLTERIGLLHACILATE